MFKKLACFWRYKVLKLVHTEWVVKNISCLMRNYFTCTEYAVKIISRVLSRGGRSAYEFRLALFLYVANQGNGKRPLYTGAIRLLAN